MPNSPVPAPTDGPARSETEGAGEVAAPQRVLRCPKCGDRDNLVLIELHEEWGATDPGRIEYDAHGSLIPPGDFWFSPGDPIHVLAECASCSHEWRPRAQTIAGPAPQRAAPRTPDHDETSRPTEGDQG